jgi:hypothetical protein
MQTIPTATVKTATCATKYILDIINGDTTHTWTRRTLDCTTHGLYTVALYRNGEPVHFINVDPSKTKRY